MRFYFQDKAAGNFATKCIRVSSTATTQDVLETLAEKFRPDMRMLSSPKYSLYEVHVSGEERRLDIDEKPLVVQLNWNKDDREGRFVLKNENDAVPAKKAQSNGPEKQEKEGVIQNFKRTLSKKEKKEKKKREKEAMRQASDRDDRPFHGDDTENSRLAAEVYKDMPETSFTRTISNPEVVMKRRRQQKLEKRMQEFRSSDGRPDSGGTLRIYADSLKPNIPYKTILLSTTDPADFAVAEALEKYGLEKENPKDYCIARVMLPPGAQHSDEKAAEEIILDDDECPLQIFREWPNDRGILVFQLKRRPPDYIPKKSQKHMDGKPLHGKERVDGSGYGAALPPEKLPYLVELSPDGSDSRDKPKLYRLQLSVTEVGTEKFDDGSIQLFGSGIEPHHCDLTNMDGVVTVTPRSMDAETYVDGQRISETTMLHSGMKVQFGVSHVFKFVDPSQDHALPKRSVDGGLMAKGPRQRPGIVQETTFDLGGDVHSGTALPASKSSSRLDGDRGLSAAGTAERGMVKPMVRVEQQLDYRRQESRTQDAPGPDLILPASIEFRESSEDSFLSAIINYTNSSTVHFKLSPTYVLYMACRYVLSSQYRPDVSPAERTHKVIAIVNKMVSMMEGVIQEVDQVDQKQKNIAGALAFWMANASELLNFIKQDRDLSRITLDAQDVLAHLVQMAFKYLVHCLQSELNNYMPAFLDDPEENSLQRPKIDDVLHTLTGAMSLLRRCRVNAALTIQLFSQLFHFINMWLFNRLVTDPASGLCSHYWGAIIRQQLGHVEAWAEKQGLELAADCHLSRIVQATTLLTMDKYAPDDIPNINSTCFKLNSLQLQALLQNYHCAPDEPFVPTDLMEHVVAVAENTADELARSDGREVQLEEDPDLQLPFLLPEDGYSCDVVRNIPNGLQEFLDPLCQRGFCRLIPHPRSPGTWTIYFEGADYESHLTRENTELAQPLRKEPEVITVTLKKQNGMGLSIVAAKGAGQDKLGIYVKSVVKGGAADVDGRLAAGDQLLSVDGRSLVGLSQERAAELMTRTSSVVTLEVAKQGAIYHGLATLLNQPSPMMQRISDRRGSGKPRPKSEGFELYNNSAQNGSPESPQMPWAEYSEPKKLPGDDRLMKNRADHRSSPNVANEPPSPGGKGAYTSGTAAKITSVSTGNLCAEEQTPPPRAEAYPIPTQTYTREYFTFPASKSQDRTAPPQDQWPCYEEKPHVHTDGSHSSTAVQRVTRSQEELREDVAYHLERQRVEAAMEHRSDSGDAWLNQGSSLGSSTSSQEHLGPPSKAGTPASTLTKSGPGQQVAAERKKREEQQRWYEKEKARLEEERERRRREQELLTAPLCRRRRHTEAGVLCPEASCRDGLPLVSMAVSCVPVTAAHPCSTRVLVDALQALSRDIHGDAWDKWELRRGGEAALAALVPGSLSARRPTWAQGRPPLRSPTSSRTRASHALAYGTGRRAAFCRTCRFPAAPDSPSRPVAQSGEPAVAMAPLPSLQRDSQLPGNLTTCRVPRLRPGPCSLCRLSCMWPPPPGRSQNAPRPCSGPLPLQKRPGSPGPQDASRAHPALRPRLLALLTSEGQPPQPCVCLCRVRVLCLALGRSGRALNGICPQLQDEERRRQQQLEEMRTREAEQRARQEEQRARREAEEKRRQEEGYYSRLEAERRRQHDEAERQLLEPEELGLGRPPLPRGYEPSAPAPPPPPQRTASYLQAQVLSPDALYTAKLVAYTEEDDDEDGGPAGPNSYVGSAGTLIGTHDVYRDPREKLSKSQDADVPGGPGAPENLTFRERQRLFSQGHDVSNKVKASRKLTELENELNTK
ncbi:afadin [Neophocaena asiaeorientalis asiaeorientalis]|uniref:Afadin n=1 Tax=Neophocaena asiaeorientalis asiaeorientalis TaxID=1706337 RepID=A0A341BD83_NEOAA|nr:afadin [Neophocaena asiaeorientalis asiaeorientalis]